VSESSDATARARIIRTPKIRSNEIKPSISATVSPSSQLILPESKTVPTTPKPETNLDEAPLSANQLLRKNPTQTSKIPIGILDRIFDPAIQYRLFLVFLSIWGAAFVLFYISTSFAVILFSWQPALLVSIPLVWASNIYAIRDRRWRITTTRYFRRSCVVESYDEAVNARFALSSVESELHLCFSLY
jgi:hypothetical protein